ncbi:MAG: hypothetical protein AAFW84_11570 [Cyanobacteria bacterium J06635_15]
MLVATLLWVCCKQTLSVYEGVPLSQQSSASQASSTRPIIIFCIGWAVLSALFFLLFGVRAPGEEELPNWFLIGINLLEIIAFALATVLCFRNANSPQIISGRGVWLSIGIGMLAFTLGDVLFALWGTYWGLDPAVSLGDFFYLLSYIFLFIGMFQAVLPRRIDLTLPQWMLIFGIGIVGVVLSYFLNYQVAVAADLPTPVSQVSVTDVAAGNARAEGLLAAQSTSIAQTPPAPEAPPPPETVAPETLPEVSPAADPEVAVESASSAPDWVIAADEMLAPMEDFVGLLYVVGDCLLVVIAGMLLVAFWGGRFSQTWRLIAIAAFFLYVADMLFAYDLSRDAYIEGAFWEVFWTFSAIFFALGATVEYDISTRSRRGTRRRS